LLWLELQERYPAKSESTELRLFESVFSFLLLTLVVAWIFAYWEQWKGLVVPTLFIVFSSATTWAIQKWSVFTRLFGESRAGRKGLRYLFFAATVGLLFCLTLLGAAAVGVRITPWLEHVRNEMVVPISSDAPTDRPSSGSVVGTVFVSHDSIRAHILTFTSESTATSWVSGNAAVDSLTLSVLGDTLSLSTHDRHTTTRFLRSGSRLIPLSPNASYTRAK
jgi:hypothetical protein